MFMEYLNLEITNIIIINIQYNVKEWKLMEKLIFFYAF